METLFRLLEDKHPLNTNRMPLMWCLDGGIRMVRFSICHATHYTQGAVIILQLFTIGHFHGVRSGLSWSILPNETSTLFYFTLKYY